MSIDLDELWPPASALMGLLFENEEEFRRCLSVLDQEPDTYRVVNWKEPNVIVRRDELPRLRAAGLSFTEVELDDPELLSPEERYRLDSEIVHSEAVQQRMAEMLRGPRGAR